MLTNKTNCKVLPIILSLCNLPFFFYRFVVHFFNKRQAGLKVKTNVIAFYTLIQIVSFILYATY